MSSSNFLTPATYTVICGSSLYIRAHSQTWSVPRVSNGENWWKLHIKNVRFSLSVAMDSAILHEWGISAVFFLFAFDCSLHDPDRLQLCTITTSVHHTWKQHNYVRGWKGRLVGPWTAGTFMHPCLSIKWASSPDTLLTFMSVWDSGTNEWLSCVPGLVW